VILKVFDPAIVPLERPLAIQAECTRSAGKEGLPHRKRACAGSSEASVSLRSQSLEIQVRISPL
jgi:hypothetical protein